MKIKHIALAVLAATSFGAAHAAVDTGIGTAQVFFLAHDMAGTNSYLFNTGLSFNALASNSITYTSSAIGADANWASFVSTLGGLSNVVWAVEALQFGNGTNGQFYGTLASGLNGVTTNIANSALKSTFGSINTPLTNAADPSEVAANGSAQYLGGKDGFLTMGVSSFSNVVGATGVKFFGAGLSSTVASAKTLVLTSPTETASFSSNGTLTISAVPEPESYGLALVGLVLAGAVARRRAAK